MFAANEDQSGPPPLNSVGSACQPQRAWNMSPRRGSRRGRSFISSYKHATPTELSLIAQVGFLGIFAARKLAHSPAM